MKKETAITCTCLMNKYYKDKNEDIHVYIYNYYSLCTSLFQYLSIQSFVNYSVQAVNFLLLFPLLLLHVYIGDMMVIFPVHLHVLKVLYLRSCIHKLPMSGLPEGHCQGQLHVYIQWKRGATKTEGCFHVFHADLQPTRTKKL